MKRLYMIGGAMGVGKTAVGQALKRQLDASVFLDGDWCWDMHPFQVTEETRAMVIGNIVSLLGSFLRCTAFDNVIFCWVMHRQEIVNAILSALDTQGCRVLSVSLVCTPAVLQARLQKDIAAGRRTADVIARSLARLPLYEKVDSLKVDVSDKSPQETARLLAAL